MKKIILIGAVLMMFVAGCSSSSACKPCQSVEPKRGPQPKAAAVAPATPSTGYSAL